MPLTTGDKLGPYEILSPLGAGGMGEVYKARDTRLDRLVAVKVLPDHIAHREDARARFEREARAVASLNHPNICILHDIGPNYMVMELIEGETLAARIEQGPLALDAALRYAVHIADALDRAHRAGVTHRDIKPHNIMITRDGVKVLDFGLAKAAAPTPGPTEATVVKSLTTEGTVLGTPQYMAPEQFEGKEADARSDVWAFGAVLYEMVTGRKAFEGKNYTSLVAAILGGEPAPMAVKPFTPAWLERMVRRCLAKDADDRYQSMRDLAMDLKSPPAETATLAKSSRWPWVVAAALAVALIPASMGWFRRAESPLRPLVRFDILPGPETDAAVLFNRIAISPDGQRLIYGTREGGTPHLASWLLDQGVSVPIAGTDGALSPVFSPDGEWLAVTDDRKLKRLSLRGGVAQELAATTVQGISWSPAGIYYRVNTRSVISFLPATGGAPQAVSQFVDQEVTHRYPQAAAGGRILIFTSSKHGGNYEDANVVGIDLKTGRRAVLRRNAYYGRYLGPEDGPGFLLSMSQGALHAQAMDPVGLTVSESAIPVLQGVAAEPTNGMVNLDVSPAGTLVFTEGKAQALPRLQLVEGGGKARELTPATGRFAGARFSPDGKRVAYWMPGTEQGIWVLDLALGTGTRITFDGPDAGPTLPIWSHDGKHIAYSSQGQLWWVRSEGGGRPQAILQNRYFVKSVSPDGRSLLLLGHKTMYAASLEGGESDRPRVGEPRVIAASQADIFDPALSPDGKWIAYTSDESGYQQVYVTAFPTPAGKWQVSTNVGRSAAWSRQELFFQDQSNRLQSAPYSASGESFRLGAMRPWGKVSVNGLLASRNFDVTPDGERVVVLLNEETDVEAKTPGRITVLLNFYDELVRKMGKR
ncbi:MAG: protein kinase [Bryobacteraceae bacterium]